MDFQLTKVKWQVALTYSYDIVIYLHLPNEHTDHGRDALTLLHEAGVISNLKKWKIFLGRTDYIGHVTRLGLFELSK